METRIFDDKLELGKAAAEHAAKIMKSAIGEYGKARFIAATGASQFEFLNCLTKTPGINWARAEMFHLDEYVGLAADHPASFRTYLKQRLIDPTGMAKYHFIDGEAADLKAECWRVGDELTRAPIDVAFVGIGENGHLAFNDPPADFETEEPYIVVQLDEACRRQQLGEGWFDSLEAVPSKAVSMSIRQIMKSKRIVCVVPDARKAQAVRDCLEGGISPMHPASILVEHPDVTVYLDRDSAGLLTK